MKIMVLNGPNLNMVGIREKELYGSATYADMISLIESEAAKRNIEVDCRQSNHEGDLIDWMHEAYFNSYTGIVINPGGYTFTSVALADCVKAIAPLPVVEIHITDVDSRESFRHNSYMAPYCLDRISGHGFNGYVEGIDEIIATAASAE